MTGDVCTHLYRQWLPGAPGQSHRMPCANLGCPDGFEGDVLVVIEVDEAPGLSEAATTIPVRPVVFTKTGYVRQQRRDPPRHAWVPIGPMTGDP